MKIRFLAFITFLVFNKIAYAQFPIDFSSKPVINPMAAGQTQSFTFTIRNNLQKVTLPIQTISIVNDGDSQPAAATSQTNNCSSTLAPGATCDITVSMQPNVGSLNRHLNIDYQGRSPLTAPLQLQIKQAAYTVLVYIVGADLESGDGAATFNINQMAQIGSSANLNIILETGGANKPGWTTVKRKIVLKNSVREVQDLGSLSMALNSTISDFFQWGMTTYPADHYIAVFWDHGGGPNYGYGGDEVHGKAATSIANLSDVMRTISYGTNKKFEIIGFDTCLLGNIETYGGLYQYTNYLIGSEDLEPGEGWQYNTFLDYVAKNGSANGLQIGKVIADGYTAQNNNDSTTISVVEAAQVPDVIDKITTLSQNLINYSDSNIQNWKILARTRLHTPDYATSVWDKRSDDVADLQRFAMSIATGISSDTNVVNAANALTSAVTNAVKYKVNSSNRSASYGLSIYFPSLMPYYTIAYPTKTFLNGVSFFSTQYTDLVSRYYNFYNNNIISLIGFPTNLTYDGTNYTADVSNDYEEIYATVGNDACTNVLSETGVPIGTVPCFTALQTSGVSSTSAGGNIWNIAFNKNNSLNAWPLLNNQPALLITVDTEPVIPNEVSYLIPVARQSDLEAGYLNIRKDSSGNYVVSGFQQDSGSVNTQSKVTDIIDGTRFLLRTYAQVNGNWDLHITTTQVTAPFAITMGALGGNFNAFRFLVADLTGQLNISSASESY